MTRLREFSDKRNRGFLKSLIKGNLGELIFERLAVYSGWYVKYTGDQYSKIISPETGSVIDNQGTPDFEISRDPDFSKSFSVEVKMQFDFNRKDKAHKIGDEDFRVVLATNGHAVYSQDNSEKLGISMDDWHSAVEVLGDFVGVSGVDPEN